MEDILRGPQLPILVIMDILCLERGQGLVKLPETGTTHKYQDATKVMETYQCFILLPFLIVSINIYEGKQAQAICT